MDKAEHGRRLKAAMSLHRQSRQAIADLTNKGERTVTNWTTGFSMPDEADRANLRRVLGDYDAPGDPVESAVKASRLTEDRQYKVLGVYKRELREQDEDQDRKGTA